MLDKHLIKALSKVYRHENSDIDYEKNLSTYDLPSSLSTKQKSLIVNSGFEINQIQSYTHDDFIKELKDIVLKGIVSNDAATQHFKTLERLTANVFIKAVGSGWHRGIQPILSYYFAKHLSLHDFEPLYYVDYDVAENCKVCGLKQHSWRNNSKDLYNLHIGYLNLESAPFLILDLKDIMTVAPKQIIATQAEKDIFFALIDLIEQAEPNETVSKLEKRISKSKLLPNSNSCTRLRVLWCLAELGILNNELVPNYSIMDEFYTYEQRFFWELQLHEQMPARADPVFPASAWCGSLGINRDNVDKLMRLVTG